MNWSGFRYEDPFFGDNPFVSFKRLQNEVNRLFELPEQLRRTSVDSRAGYGNYPPLNFWVNDESAVAELEVPGVDPKAIDLSVLGKTLTIKGERTGPDPVEGVKVVRRERGSGSFVRTLELPFEVEASKIDAECRNGILTIRLPRAEEEKPRRISVKQ